MSHRSSKGAKKKQATKDIDGADNPSINLIDVTNKADNKTNKICGNSNNCDS